jgi:hypothetical protein
LVSCISSFQVPFSLFSCCFWPFPCERGVEKVRWEKLLFNCGDDGHRWLSSAENFPWPFWLHDNLASQLLPPHGVYSMRLSGWFLSQVSTSNPQHVPKQHAHFILASWVLLISLSYLSYSYQPDCNSQPVSMHTFFMKFFLIPSIPYWLFVLKSQTD